MTVEQVTFRWIPGRQYPMDVTIPETLEPENIKEIFGKLHYDIGRVLSITGAPITFKAVPEKLTDSAVSRVFKACKALVEAKNEKKIALEMVEEEKDDFEIETDFVTESAEKVQKAAEEFEKAKKATDIEIVYNPNF